MCVLINRFCSVLNFERSEIIQYLRCYLAGQNGGIDSPQSAPHLSKVERASDADTVPADDIPVLREHSERVDSGGAGLSIQFLVRVHLRSH